MKPPQFYITAGLGLLCLVLSVTNIVLSQANAVLQFEANRLQEQIASGNNAGQILQNIVRDVAANAGNNEKLQTLLKQNGYTLNHSGTAE